MCIFYDLIYLWFFSLCVSSLCRTHHCVCGAGCACVCVLLLGGDAGFVSVRYCFSLQKRQTGCWSFCFRSVSVVLPGSKVGTARLLHYSRCTLKLTKANVKELEPLLLAVAHSRAHCLLSAGENTTAAFLCDNYIIVRQRQQ